MYSTFIKLLFGIVLLCFVDAAIKPDKPGAMAIWKYTGCLDSDDFSPDPSDCQKFYRCSHGYQFTFRCGDGTAFDRHLKVCNYKDSVDCEGEDSSDSSNSSSGSTSSGGVSGISGVSGVTSSGASGATSSGASGASSNPSATTASGATTGTGTTASAKTTTVTDLDPNLCNKLSEKEKSIFCDSATFKQYYPNCCAAALKI